MRFYTKLLILIYILTFSQVTFAKIISADNLIIPTGFTFLKNLVYRSTLAPDTRYLQNLLNMNTETKLDVPEGSWGSNSNLVDSFGGKTKSALERFHIVYNKDIQKVYKDSNPNATTTFTPNSLILDFYTRSVMNDLVVKYQKERDGKNATTTATSTYTTTQEKSNSSVLAAIAAIGVLGGSSGGSSNAASGIIPFGGKSVSMVPCTCSGNILLYIVDTKGVTLPLIYQPGVTVLYKMGNPTSGTNMLGQYVAGGVCLVPGTPCTVGGTPIGTMIQLGTSLSSAGF